MNRFIVLLLAGAMLALPCSSYAQHGGHGGQHGGGGKGGERGDPKAAEESAKVINDLHYAMAVQATPDQVPQFKAAAASIQAARQRAAELQKLADGADIPALIKTLSDAVEQARSDNDSFVKNFTPPQKSLLKNLVKKLNKADSEVAKSSRDLDQHSGDKARVASAAAQLQKALADFQKQQADLGAEMGL